MQFFYIDYMNNGKKERNIGFLRVENDGISVGLRGVPTQCGDRCKVYVVNIYSEEILLGEVPVKGGYGMENSTGETGPVSRSACVSRFPCMAAGREYA